MCGAQRAGLDLPWRRRVYECGLRVAGGRTFWRRNRHTQKRLQAWIGDACKRRLFRSRPQARCGKQSHCEVKEKYMTRTTIGAGLMAFISCIAFGQPAAHPPAFEVASVKV